jgi:hypothetical protein
MSQWLIACKEINGSIYVTRLGQTLSGPKPGVPDTWVFVGPGNNPSVQHYGGNQFILIFEFLSHLVVRVFDITTWPPTEVNPISVAGGPNPPSAFLFGVATGGTAKMPNDEYIFRVPTSNLGVGQVKNQYDPPYLQHVLIFHDPVNHTFSVELKPDPTWHTNAPNTPNFFRLYRAPLGSSSFTRISNVSTITNVSISGDLLTVTAANKFLPGDTIVFAGLTTATFLNGVRVLVNTSNANVFTANYVHADYASAPDTGTATQDWATVLDFTDVMPDSSPFQFQYAASIGAYFNPALPSDITDHEESFKGPILGFDSTVGPLGFLLILADTLPLIAGSILATHVPSMNGYGIFTPTQRFIEQVFTDSMDFPGLGASRQEVPTSGASSMGSRSGFLSFPQSDPGAFSDRMKFGQEAVPVIGQPPTTLPGGNAACQVTAT